eukprot:GILK01007217.1.p1 GENE.GILK01007217.1~~GILK01007217.1.p1  ORF type:complete len:131 (+),score=20.03 GILK01007217.1:32-394(+)
MNAPERWELFVLPEHLKKLTYDKDQKISNAGSFTIRLEDHTLGNIIRMQLHRDEKVLFAGYQAPHPLEHNIVIRIQTTNDSTPHDALKKSIRDLTGEISTMEERFKEQLQLKNNPRENFF